MRSDCACGIPATKLSSRPNMKRFLCFLITLASLSLSGCGFNHEYKKALAAYEAGRYEAPAGPWAGEWTTTTNGHSGDLRAIVTPAENEPGSYDFRYHATWAKILSGGYKVRFPVEKRGSHYVVDGEQNLGFFGTFGHKATIDSDSFDATYSNDKGDLGNFSLRRPR